MKMLIKNIKGLVGAREEAPSILKGADMKDLPIIEDAWLAVEDGVIADFGKMEDWPGISDWRDLEVMEADGKFILPGFVDSHTHIVYAANREGEFVDRIKGLTYAEIAEKGGGILNSARILAEASEDDLFEAAFARAEGFIHMGTTALEVKSGYGLSIEAELKMLRVIRRLEEALPIPVRSTFLGMHAIPMEYKGNPEAYIDLVINEMLPAVAEEKLADYVDAFLEDGYFSAKQTVRLIEAADKYGLDAKIHVNQFTATGGVRACAEAGALTLDHLEELTDDDVQAMLQYDTIPVALPSCSFFLSIPYTPARQIIDAGLPIVLASDYNPGSTPNGNMSLVIAMACIKMNMLPEEAINAATLNAAAALQLSEVTGSITPGMRADFIMTKPMSSINYLPYSFGEQLVDGVFVEGVRQ
ncbi:MAG: imidazolonepropionase [Flavobacteriales bacterium]|nr:imidazolonepropionase [Flavobacteriales bacterium]